MVALLGVVNGNQTPQSPCGQALEMELQNSLTPWGGLFTSELVCFHSLLALVL